MTVIQWDSPEIQEVFRFWLPLFALSLIAIGVLAYEMRRVGYTLKDLGIAILVAVVAAPAFLLLLGLVYGAAWLFVHIRDAANMRFAGIPAYDTARVVVGLGIHVIGLAIMAGALCAGIVYGVYGIVAPFTLLRWRRIGRWHRTVEQKMRQRSGSAWALATMLADWDTLRVLAEIGPWGTRVLLWLRHEVAAVLLVLIAYVALLRLVGRIEHSWVAAWAILQLAIIAFAVHPHESESDRLEVLDYDETPEDEAADAARGAE